MAERRADVGLLAWAPGAGAWAQGRRADAVVAAGLFAGWAAYAVSLRGRIAAAFRGGSLDARIASWTVLLVLLALYLVPVFVARAAGRPRRAGGSSQWRLALRDFRRNRLAVVGAVLVVLLNLVALLAPFLATHDPVSQVDVMRERYRPPGHDHWMGTDKFGRDIYSRILYGSRVSLSIGFLAVTLSVLLGASVGAVAGYAGGAVDNVLMRFVDLLLAFPLLFLILTIVALFSPSVFLIVAVLGLTTWMDLSRIVRGQVLTLKEQDFVQAARAMGLGAGRMVLRHLLPNTVAPIIVYATLRIGTTILVEAFLSYLGLGVQPPAPSWGNIVAEGQESLLSAWWISFFPGTAIVLTVMAYNLLGDGLRDAFDPRVRPGAPAA